MHLDTYLYRLALKISISGFSGKYFLYLCYVSHIIYLCSMQYMRISLHLCTYVECYSVVSSRDCNFMLVFVSYRKNLILSKIQLILGVRLLFLFYVWRMGWLSWSSRKSLASMNLWGKQRERTIIGILYVKVCELYTCVIYGTVFRVVICLHFTSYAKNFEKTFWSCIKYELMDWRHLW